MPTTFITTISFPPNLDRAELYLDQCPDGMDLKDYVFFSISLAIAEKGYDLIVIDNMSALGSHTEQAKFAIPLMQAINHVKRKFGITMLVLAHTPKRDASRPLSLNDLQGSASLRNLTDAVFAIGKSQKDPGMRYLKQLKPRSVELIYGEENVIVCDVTKDSNFLGLKFREYSREAEHLLSRTDEERAMLVEQVQQMKGDGQSIREIAEKVGASKSTVARILSPLSHVSHNGTSGTRGTPCTGCKKRPSVNHGLCLFCA
jgi:KaiC/GvpD/RAD55 family RecA-like ATPase